MEEVLPPETEQGAGFESTRLPQFTVFLENRVGKLGPLVRLFEEHCGRINALAIEESADAALIRVICSSPESGRTLLKEHGFSFTETDVLAVELPRKSTKPMAGVCTALLAAEINIHYAYPMLVPPRGPVVVLYVDDPTMAARILIKKRFNLIGLTDLGS
jgi:hypothetical protein